MGKGVGRGEVRWMTVEEEDGWSRDEFDADVDAALLAATQPSDNVVPDLTVRTSTKTQRLHASGRHQRGEG